MKQLLLVVSDMYDPSDVGTLWLGCSFVLDTHSFVVFGLYLDFEFREREQRLLD